MHEHAVFLEAALVRSAGYHRFPRASYNHILALVGEGVRDANGPGLALRVVAVR